MVEVREDVGQQVIEVCFIRPPAQLFHDIIYPAVTTIDDKTDDDSAEEEDKEREERRHEVTSMSKRRRSRGRPKLSKSRQPVRYNGRMISDSEPYPLNPGQLTEVQADMCVNKRLRIFNDDALRLMTMPDQPRMLEDARS